MRITSLWYSLGDHFGGRNLFAGRYSRRTVLSPGLGYLKFVEKGLPGVPGRRQSRAIHASPADLKISP
jgi:hypothetical protein